MDQGNTEKRLLLAFALSLVVYVIWQATLPPPPPPPQQIEQPAPAGPEPEAPRADPGRAAAEADPAAAEGPGYEAVAAAAIEETRYENGHVAVRFSNEGARVLSWQLKDYTTKDGKQLELVPEFSGNGAVFPLAVMVEPPELAREINSAPHRVERGRVDGGTQFRFRWADGTGLEVDKTLTFRDGEYLVDVTLDVSDRGRRLPARLAWGPGFGAQDPAAENSTYYYSGQVVWNLGGQVTRERKHKVDPGQRSGPLRWVGLEDQYFAALVLPREATGSATIEVEELVRVPLAADAAAEASEAEPEKVATVAVAVPAEGAQLYVGPKKYTLLRGLGHELEKVVWFSSNGFLAAVSKFLFLCLLWVYDHTIANYGMAIILTTIVLRLLLFPLNQYSMVSIKKSQAQMQRLQPKVQAIKNRYKKSKDAESRRKMNEETMALYKKEGVNPMGGLTGCLPMLMQFPILIGFYNMLTVAVELRGAPFFGWIQDLSEKDPFWITPLLMGVTMFLQQKMAMTKVTDPTQLQQQRIMMFMPLFFTWICINMPSGLVLYWFVNNLLGIGQQWLVNKRADQLVPQPEPEKAHGRRKRVRRSDAAGGS